MTMFLAAAAGFLKGKAELAEAKREEERAVREEERQLDRQMKLYQFQYDIQSRSKRDEEASALAQKVQSLVRVAGIDEGTAINIVQSGAYDAVFKGALEGTINPVAVQSTFGNTEDTAPAQTPDPATYTMPSATPVRRGTGIYLPREAEGRTAAQTVTDINSFDRAMTDVLASILPQGTFEIRSTPDGSGTHIISSNRATSNAKAGIVTEAFRAYTSMVEDQGVPPPIALARIRTFVSNQGQEITDFNNYDDLVAKIYEPLRSLMLGEDVVPRYFTPTTSVPSVTPQGPAGVVPSSGWNTGVNFN